MSRPKLYHYWRSSSSWRVRWALALKGIDYEPVALNLLDNETETPEHLARNPLGTVPVLEMPASEGGRCMSESIAIIEWAEETRPEPKLLPGDAVTRAHLRMLAEIINSSTQPLQNLGVSQMHSDDPAEQKRWNLHWNRRGLASYEALARAQAGRFSYGDTITLPDLFLIPQCYNARRLDIALSDYPTIARIFDAAIATDAARASAPESFEPKS